MKLEREDWIGLAGSTLLIAALLYLATCAGAGMAGATEHEVRWVNTDPTRTAGALRVCQLERCVDVPASCGPGATCATVVDLAPGAWPTTAFAAELEAGPWSPPSNVLDIRVAMEPADCLALDACRFDADGQGTVNGLDFLRFLGAFGSGWP